MQRTSPQLPFVLLMLAFACVTSVRKHDTGPGPEGSSQSPAAASTDAVPALEVLRGDAFWVAAPDDLPADAIGMPVAATFVPLRGHGSVVAREYQITDGKSRIESGYVEMSDSRELAASLAAWKGSIGGSVETTHRVVTLETRYIRSLTQLSMDAHLAALPEGTAYVITGVELGHLLQWRLTQDQRSLRADVALQVKVLGKKVGADLRGGLEKLGVDADLYALGVKPDNDKSIVTLFARGDTSAFESTFSAPLASAQPIRVQYTPVIGSAAPKSSVLAWKDAYQIRLDPKSLTVLEDGSWGVTDWRLGVECERDGAPIRRRHIRRPDNISPEFGDEVRNRENEHAKGLDEERFEVFNKPVSRGQNYVVPKQFIDIFADPGERIECRLLMETRGNARFSKAWSAPTVTPILSDVVGSGKLVSGHQQLRLAGLPGFVLLLDLSVRNNGAEANP